MTVSFPVPEQKPASEVSMADILRNNPERPEGVHSARLAWTQSAVEVIGRDIEGPLHEYTDLACQFSIPLREKVPGTLVNRALNPDIAALPNGEAIPPDAVDARRRIVDTLNFALSRMQLQYEHQFEFTDLELAELDPESLYVSANNRLIVPIGRLKGKSSFFRSDAGGMLHEECARMVAEAYPALAKKFSRYKTLRLIYGVRRGG
jgi:hypothetical protein